MPVTNMRFLCCIIALALSGTSASALADDDGEDHDRVRRAVLSGQLRPLEEIMAKARAEYGGHILDTEMEEKHGEPVYEIKLLDNNGRLVKLVYDARDGSLIRASRKKGDRGDR